LEPQNTHHPARHSIRSRLHGLASPLNHAESIRKSQRSGKNQRRVLAQAKAGCRPALSENIGVVGTKRFKGCQARYEDGWLTDSRRIQLGFRPAKTDIRKVVAQDARSLLVEPAGGWQGLIQRAAH